MSFHGAPGFELGDGRTTVDPGVIAALPENSRVISTDQHGNSFWASTGRIDVEFTDGQRQSFFIKVLSKDVGKHMVHGEFESMTALYNYMPEFVPRPIAWGTYVAIPDTHFFLCEFREMADDMPDPDKFTARLAALHRNSCSPTGKFGFHVTTYSGNLPQMVEWEDSWERFFSKSLRHALDLEIAAKGFDSEFESLVPAIFDRVIPRLLRPLETHGRKVKPSLVHGDLWYANSGVDIESDEPLIFDACVFYAHNEYEFGQWMPACNRFGSAYLHAYQQHVVPSEPQADYQGRLDLYKLRFNTHVSALFTDNMTLRNQMLGDMRDLVAKYGHGLEAEPSDMEGNTVPSFRNSSLDGNQMASQMQAV